MKAPHARSAKNALRRLAGREQLQTVFERLDRQRGRIEKLEKGARGNAKEAEFYVREINRVSPQLSALESKVEDLRQALTTPLIGAPEDLDTARSLIDEIRAEHARIRVRLSAVTTYEERLRRIEEKLGLPHD
jgi:phage shock protein A